MTKKLIFMFLISLAVVCAVNDLDEFIYNHLTWFGQSSFVITAKSGQILYIDPVKVPENFAAADLILITHNHLDHFNLGTVLRLKKPNTLIISPASMGRPDWQGMVAWQTIQKGSFQITAVPAYNTRSEYHPQNQGWLGYIVEVDGIKIYHAGDSDLIPEMGKIHADIAFLPIGGKYTMDIGEAIKATQVIKAKIFIPMHYGEGAGASDSGIIFASLLKSGKAKVLSAVH